MLPILRKVYFKKFCFLVCLCACIITAWCENSINSNSLSISVSDYIFEYNGNTKLEQISLKSDEDKEIIALYQEAWENVWYRDSLLIAEKYAQIMVEEMDKIRDNPAFQEEKKSSSGSSGSSGSKTKMGSEYYANISRYLEQNKRNKRNRN